MNNQLYILVNIGCIECGVDSNIVGVFDDLEKAEVLKDDLDASDAVWRQGGQNHYKIFSMPELNVINEEYKEYLSDKA